MRVLWCVHLIYLPYYTHIICAVCVHMQGFRVSTIFHHPFNQCPGTHISRSIILLVQTDKWQAFHTTARLSTTWVCSHLVCECVCARVFVFSSSTTCTCVHSDNILLRSFYTTHTLHTRKTKVWLYGIRNVACLEPMHHAHSNVSAEHIIHVYNVHTIYSISENMWMWKRASHIVRMCVRVDIMTHKCLSAMAMCR